MANIGMIQDINVGVVTALLELKDNGFFDTLNQASSAVEKFESNTNSGMSSLEKTSRLTGDIGTSLYRNVTVPAIQAGKSILGAFESTESAFTGVQKTLNEDELIRQFGSLEKAYSTLDDAIWKMTQETGSSYESIAAVMEMAGQLNVPIGEAGKSLIDFTKNIIMLNDTTDLLGAEAAKDLAQFMNIMGTSSDDVNNLGAAIVHLGNNSATTEADIVSMAMRLAGAGNSIGLTEQEVLAIAATLSSVGISAEMGGSAFSKAMKKMQVAAETGYEPIIDLQSKTGLTLREMELMSTNNAVGFIGLADSLGMTTTELKAAIKAGNQLNDFAEVANMTTEDFVKLYREDAMSAIEAFIIGLGDTESHGESTIQMLQEMGFTEVRLSDALTRMSLAQGELTRELDLANTAWSEGTALQEEADKRYGDLAVQISQLREELKSLMVDLAELFVPILREIVEILKVLIGWLRGLPDWLQAGLVGLTAVLAVLGPILLAISKISGAILNLKTFFGGIMKIGILDNCHKLGDCMENTAGKITKVGGAFKTVGSVIGTVLKVISGIAIAIGGAVLAVKNFIDMWTNGVNVVNALLTVLGSTLVGVGLVIAGIASWPAIIVGAVVGAIAVIVAAIHEHWDEIKAWWSGLIDHLKQEWNNFTEALSAKWEETKDKFRRLGKEISDIFHNLWENLKEAASNVVEAIKESWNGFVEFWQGLGDSIKEIWDGICNFLFGGIEQALSDIRGAINRWFYEHFGEDGLFSGIPAIIWSGLQLIVGFVQTGINLVHDILSGLFNILVDLFTGNFDKLIEDLKTLIFNIRADLSDISLDVYDFFVTVFNTVKEGFDKIVSSAKEFFSTIIGEVKEKIENIRSNITEKIDEIKSNVTERINQLKEAISESVEGVKESIIGVIDNIKQTASEFGENVKEIIQNVKDFIHDRIEEVKQSMKDAIEGFKNFASSVVDTIKNLLSAAHEVASNLLNAISDFFKEKLDALVSWFKEFPSKFLEMGKDILKNLGDGMKDVWENVVYPFLEEKFGWIFDIVDKIKNVFSGITGAVGSLFDGSHANGLDYVPFDGYVAQLHKGERVLTKSENEEYTNGRHNSSGGDTFNFYNTQPDPYEYARQMKRAKKELALT